MSSTALVDALFMRTVDIVQSLPKAGPIQTAYEEKLALYSLYKQATEGDVNFTRPGMFDMLGRAKWDAWAKRRGLASRDAKQLYVESMLAILRRFSDRPQAIALIEELESFSGNVEQQIMDGSFAQDDESEDTPPRPASGSRRPKAQQGRAAGKEPARRPIDVSEDEDDEEEDNDDDDEDDEDDDEDDEEDEEELDEAETYRRVLPGPGPSAARQAHGMPPPGPGPARPSGGQHQQALPPQVFYGRYGGSVTGGGPPSSWSQQSFPGPSAAGRAPSVTSGMRLGGGSVAGGIVPPPPGAAYYGAGGMGAYGGGMGAGGRAPSVAGTSFSGALPPGGVGGGGGGGGPGQHSMTFYSTASHAHGHGHGGHPQGFRGGPAMPPIPYAASSVGGPRSEVGGRALVPVAGSAAGGGAGAGGAVGAPASAAASTAAAAAAAAPLRPEVDLALQSIQASLAALHERLNRVESGGGAGGSGSSGRDNSGVGGGGGGRGGGPFSFLLRGRGDDGRSGALGSAYAGFADAFHDIAVLLGFRRGRARPSATPSFYAAGGAGGGNGGRSNDVLALAVRLGLAAVNLAVRLALDVTSVVILLSLFLTLVKRLTGRGDPLLLLRLIRRWTGVRPRTLIAATTSAAAAVAGGSASSRSGRAIGGGSSGGAGAARGGGAAK